AARDQITGLLAQRGPIATAPAGVDPQVTADGPARLLQSLGQRCDARLRVWLVRRGIHQHADAPHPLALLRARRERPRRRAAEQRDELAALHSLTSSASARIPGGNVIRSALAVLRLTASSNLTGCSTGRSAGLVPCKIFCT